MNDLIVYHAVKPGVDCPDGLAAAYVAAQYVENIKNVQCSLLPHSYGENPPNLDYLRQFKFVYIVDYSFPLSVLQSWKDAGISMMIIDHHKTALNDLSGFSDAVFDLKESGATLTWKTLFPGEPIPDYLRYVKDRDLWEWKLSYTEEICEAISSERYAKKKELDDFEYKDWLDLHLNKLFQMDQEQLIEAYKFGGEELLKPKRDKIKLLAGSSFRLQLGENAAQIVLISEAEGRLSSDLATYLYKNYECDYAIIISRRDKDDAPKGWALSFRSDNSKPDGGFDVSELAKLFGGGGHKNASGAFVGGEMDFLQLLLEISGKIRYSEEEFFPEIEVV